MNAVMRPTSAIAVVTGTAVSLSTSSGAGFEHAASVSTAKASAQRLSGVMALLAQAPRLADSVAVRRWRVRDRQAHSEGPRQPAARATAHRASIAAPGDRPRYWSVRHDTHPPPCARPPSSAAGSLSLIHISEPTRL